jgi:hypothetical protein
MRHFSVPIALLLVFSLLALSSDLSAYKKGAKIVVHRTDGTQNVGELIFVGEDSLILLDSASNSDITLGIHEITRVTILKTSRIGLASIGGFVIGGVLGGYLGSNLNSSGDVDLALIMGLMGAVTLGAAAGLLSNALASEQKINFEGLSDEEITEVLAELRSKARVKSLK